MTQRAKLLQRRDSTQAEALYRRAVAIIEKALGPDFPAIAEPLWRLAQRLYERGAISEAGSAFQRVAAIYGNQFGSADTTTAWADSKVAAVLTVEGRYAEAEALLRHALEIYERNFGQSDADLGDILDQLGEVAARSRRYEEAVTRFRQSLSIKRRSRKQEGISWTTMRLALALGGVAAATSNEGRLEEAERLFNEARELALAGGGPRDSTTAAVLGGLAWVKNEQGFYRRAEELYREQYDIGVENREPPELMVPVAGHLGEVLMHEAHFDEGKTFLTEAVVTQQELPDVPTNRKILAAALCGLARAELRLSHYESADELATRSVALLDAANPALYNALTAQADARDGQARCQEAYQLLLRALSVVRTVDSDDSDLAWTMYNLGYFGILHDGLTVEAESAFRDALKIRERQFGSQHPSVAWALIGIADSCRAARPNDARPLLERAIEIFDATYGPDYPDAAECMTDLAELLVHGGELDRGERLLQHARSVVDAAFGGAHPILAYVLAGIAHLHFHLGQVPQALAAWKESLSILESKLGPDHPDLVACLDQFGEGLRELGRTDEAGMVKARAERLRIRHQRLDPLIGQAAVPR